jgi:predicted nucleotidyltransferase
MSEYVLDEARWPQSMAAPHREILRATVSRVREWHDVSSLLARGSFVTGEMDAESDLDLALLTEGSVRASVLQSMASRAELLGQLLACFSGEHVGLPELLICLYGPPAVSVDLKVVTIDDLRLRPEAAVLLWNRAGGLPELSPALTCWPEAPQWQWMEDRMWHWVHYVGTRVRRGELLEAIRVLDVVRTRVLGPLALAEAGANPYGVKKVERIAPARARQMHATVCGCDPKEAIIAMRAAVAVYLSLRQSAPSTLRLRSEAEALATQYLDSSAASD